MQQVATSYKLTIRNQHPIVRWITRHAAYLLHRYAVHSDGQTSLQRRWGKDHKAPLCEMAETVQYMIPTLSSQPKLEPRFFKGIWLGRDTMTGESIIGTPGKIIWVRTIRRQIYPDKYDGQLLDTINVHPWTSPTPTQAIHPALLTPANPNVSTYAIGTQTVPKTTASEGTQTQQPATIPLALPIGQQQQGTAASPTSNLQLAMSPLATSPAAAPTRAALPMPQDTTTRPQATKRTAEEATGEAESKQQRTQETTTAAQRTAEPPTQKMRIQAVTVTTKKGDKITTTSSEDEDKMEATNPNVFTFLDYESKPLQ